MEPTHCGFVCNSNLNFRGPLEALQLFYFGTVDEKNRTCILEFVVSHSLRDSEPTFLSLLLQRAMREIEWCLNI